MALRKVKTLFVDDTGRLIADLECGRRSIIGITLKANGTPDGVPGLNHDGRIPASFMPHSSASKADVEETRIRLTRACLRLLATQNKDGGWEWMNPDTNPNHGIPSPATTLGVTCQGILDCFQIGAQSRCLKACESAYDAIWVNSKDPSPSKHRVRGPDIGFMVALSQATGITEYADFAKARWISARAEFGGGSATSFAEFIRDIRKSQNLPAIISWDINLYIQSLLALESYFPGQGFAAEAKEMAEVIYTSLYVAPVDFDITDDTLNEFWNGISGAMEAFEMTDLHLEESEALITQLMGGQEDDGHWPGIVDGSDLQTTAYACLALMNVEEDRPVVSAMNFIVTNQLANGGWLYDGGENTEVTSEVMQAIYHFIF